MAELAQVSGSPQTPPANAPAAPAPAGTSTAAAPPGKTPQPGAKPTDPPPKTEEPKVSSKLTLLVQREKAAIAREQAAKAKEAAALALEQAVAAREAKVKEFESVKETNPTKALELLGMDLNGLAEVTLNDGNLTAEQKVERLAAQIAAMKKEIADKERAQLENEKSRAEQDETRAIENFKTEISSFIEENAKDYELIRFEGQQNLVYQVIGEHYARTMDETTGVGKILTKKEAADKVEKFLEGKYDKALGLEKFKSRTPKPVEPAKPPTNVPPKPQAPTLTNAMTPGNTRQPTGLLTDEQRVAKAIAFAHGLRAKS